MTPYPLSNIEFCTRAKNLPAGKPASSYKSNKDAMTLQAHNIPLLPLPTFTKISVIGFGSKIELVTAGF